MEQLIQRAQVIDCDRDHNALEHQVYVVARCWSCPMDYQRLLALLGERRALLLWEELWPDADNAGIVAIAHTHPPAVVTYSTFSKSS